MLRIIKSLLVLTIGLHALFYALQNVANLSVAHASLTYVMSGADHQVYPETLFFKLNNAVLSWLALGMVLIGEFAIGFFGIKGGWTLFRARTGTREQFHAAKKDGLIAAGLALLVWFGLFMTVGAAFFQMWQTEVGTSSMQGAFMYATASVITILFVSLTDD